MTRKFFIGFSSFFILLWAFSAFSIPAQAQSKKQLAAAKKLVAKGDDLYRQKNYRAAIDKYEQASKIAPAFASAYFSKGFAHFNLGEYDTAIESLNEAFKRGYAPAAEVYKLRGQAFYKKKDYDSALADMQQGIGLQPSNADWYVALGDVYLAKNSYADALKAFTSAAQFDPKNADVHYFMALSHNGLQQYAEQRAEAVAAIEKGTKYPSETWALIGQALQFDRKYDEAVEAYERVLIAKPDSYAVYSNLSETYRNLNRFSDAIATVKKGLRAFPNDGDFYSNLSWYYSLADMPVEAVGAARQAVSVMPDKYIGYTNLCRALSDSKEYQQAVSACNTALRLNPGDGETNFYLARAYDLQKKQTVATPYYKKAVEGLIQYTKNNPDYADGFYLLGNAYFADEKKAEAIAAYKKSLELSPKFARARYNLAIIYYLNGDKAAAGEQYNLVMKIDPVLGGKLLQVIKK